MDECEVDVRLAKRQLLSAEEQSCPVDCLDCCVALLEPGHLPAISPSSSSGQPHSLTCFPRLSYKRNMLPSPYQQIISIPVFLIELICRPGLSFHIPLFSG